MARSLKKDLHLHLGEDDMVVDVSSFVDLLPLLTFLIVFVLVFVVLNETKVVDNSFFQLLVSFLLATVFVTASGAREYVQNVIPWFAVLLVCLFFILVLIGFVGKDVASLNKTLGTGFIFLLLIVFVVSGVIVFSSEVRPYYDQLAESPRLYGALLLLSMSALVSWVLVHAKGK